MFPPLSTPETTWWLVIMWPSLSMITPEPLADPDSPDTWIVTVAGRTAAATASQSGTVPVVLTGSTVSELDCRFCALADVSCPEVMFGDSENGDCAPQIPNTAVTETSALTNIPAPSATHPGPFFWAGCTDERCGNEGVAAGAGPSLARPNADEDEGVAGAVCWSADAYAFEALCSAREGNADWPYMGWVYAGCAAFGCVYVD